MMAPFSQIFVEEDLRRPIPKRQTRLGLISLWTRCNISESYICVGSLLYRISTDCAACSIRPKSQWTSISEPT